MPVHAGDIVRVTAKLIGADGQAIENVFQLRNDGPGSVVDSLVDDDLGDWLETLYSELVPYQTGNVAYDSFIVHNVTQDITYDSFAWPTLTAGSNSSQALPPGCCLLVGLNTLVPRVHGRKYFGQFGEDTQAGGGWGAGLLTAGATIAAAMVGSFIGSVSANTWLPGVTSKDGDFWAFETARVSATCAYQRRRRPGVGI